MVSSKLLLHCCYVTFLISSFLNVADGFMLPSRNGAVPVVTQTPSSNGGWHKHSATSDRFSYDADLDFPKRNPFQQDILRDVGFSSRATSQETKRQLHQRQNTMLLLWGKNNKDQDNKNDKEEDSKHGPLSGLTEWKENAVKGVVARTPQPILDFVSNAFAKFLNFWPTFRLAFTSFGCGIIFTLSLILIPAYSSMDKVSQPVVLFETILSDLEAGYVDPVDTNKLFETGISAMLRSLDPYTEFETKEEAQTLNEGIKGRYGGVGLVISGATPKDLKKYSATMPEKPSAQQVQTDTSSDGDDADKFTIRDDPAQSVIDVSETNLDDDDPDSSQKELDEMKRIKRTVQKGIRVVSAFEGYAFDYGMRVGDRLISIDETPLTSESSVEDVRNLLRGIPNTMVSIQFQREGIPGVQEVSMPRSVVRIRDVKLATLVGNPADGIGYIRLSGFASSAGPEMRQAIYSLENAVADATNGEKPLQGLILDLRGNPGGLLTSSVDVASLLVPKGSDIVSARGRGFPGVLYKSRVDPILDSRTKLAVLVNGGTASAAEIVSGAVQDLDVGIIVGSDRTYGKGLVQNVEDLPFDTALKFTVAKYYTPSGRCIQGVQYTEGGGLNAENEGRYTAKNVADKDRQNFYTTSGRIVRDGGGVEADYKVSAPKGSVLEYTLLGSDTFSEYAAQWSRSNELTNNFEVDDRMYMDFQQFVSNKQKKGEIKLEALYSAPLEKLKTILKQSEFKSSENEVERLQKFIVGDLQRDFEKYKVDIKEDIANAILSRYLPESMLLQRSLKSDQQVEATVKLLKNNKEFDRILARGNQQERDGAQNTQLASSLQERESNGAKVSVKF